MKGQQTFRIQMHRALAAFAAVAAAGKEKKVGPPKYARIQSGFVLHKKERDKAQKMKPVTYLKLIDRSRYTGSQLRELRKLRGVGRLPHKLKRQGD